MKQKTKKLNKNNNAELIYCRFKFNFNVADAEYVFWGCTYCSPGRRNVVIRGQTEIFKMASKMFAATRDLLFFSIPGQSVALQIFALGL